MLGDPSGLVVNRRVSAETKVLTGSLLTYQSNALILCMCVCMCVCVCDGALKYMLEVDCILVEYQDLC